MESETERLWKDEILSNLHNNALVDEPVLKSYFVTAMVQEPIQPLLEEVNKRSMRMPWLLLPSSQEAKVDLINFNFYE